MCVKIFRLREDGERMKSYKCLSSVKAIQQDLSGLTFTLWNGFGPDREYRLDFEGQKYELEVYP